MIQLYGILRGKVRGLVNIVSPHWEVRTFPTSQPPPSSESVSGEAAASSRVRDGSRTGQWGQ